MGSIAIGISIGIGIGIVIGIDISIGICICTGIGISTFYLTFAQLASSLILKFTCWSLNQLSPTLFYCFVYFVKTIGMSVRRSSWSADWQQR